MKENFFTLNGLGFLSSDYKFKNRYHIDNIEFYDNKTGDITESFKNYSLLYNSIESKYVERFYLPTKTIRKTQKFKKDFFINNNKCIIGFLDNVTYQNLFQCPSLYLPNHIYNISHIKDIRCDKEDFTYQIESFFYINFKTGKNNKIIIKTKSDIHISDYGKQLNFICDMINKTPNIYINRNHIDAIIRNFNNDNFLLAFNKLLRKQKLENIL